MTAQQKYDRMERDGFRPAKVMGQQLYVTRRACGNDYRASSISALHKMIYGY